MSNDSDIAQKRLAEFNRYLAVNQRYWSQVASATARQSQAILVDLMVGHAGYLIGNCLIAKYLQEHYGYRVIGVVRSKASLTEVAVANSFCFDGFLYYDTPLPVDLKLDANQIFGGQSIEQQRKTLLNYRFGGILIGDLIYDSYMRSTTNGTIEQIDNVVLNHLLQAVRDVILFQNIIKQNQAVMSVQGHTIYSNFGTLARTLLKSGGTVFGRKFAAGPCTIRKYTSLEQIRNHEFKFSPEEFAYIYDNYHDLAIRKARNYLDQRMSMPLRNKKWDAVEAYGDHKKIYRREELDQATGFDPGKPVVGVMSHILADAPHSFDWMIYDDYYIWLQETLEIIKDIPQVNWLIKPHPDNKHYKTDHSAENLSRAYIEKYSHIALSPTDMNTASLFDIASAVVTVTGSAALEFPSKGIPAICAGKSLFTDFGFTLEPKSVDEYRTMLQNIQNLPRLDAAAIDRAHVFTYIYQVLSRVDSVYIPEMPDVFWAHREEAEIWHDAAEAVLNNRHQDDPLYHNFKIQLENDYDHMLNFDQLQNHDREQRLSHA